MSNIVRFPASRRLQATTIPREEFQRLADLALDVVDQIVAILDAVDGDADFEADADADPSLASPLSGPSQRLWAYGGDRDLEGR
ncbi:hypothetical protein ASG40_17270 [Methylobacterium sp. Leaf399]|uniref:hypothetical protein n=1 Tax=Methylobacterium sp. Leaf399 TaxID=1736364 RepID=UPI0006FE8477|nr:hypothetical protein [Methylobacterium sp. Leaf399]KQT17761.1 hypothetical protein ASG40_17270 [Methylobacterium sp. Leaf399]